MWHDIETTDDLLNYRMLATTAAQMVLSADGEPLSIGVSGSWGSGKSSLVKMISDEIKKSDKEDPGKYVFLEFNAWLYQGFDDARIALLQSVADKLEKEATKREKGIDKAKEFIKRINWLKLGKLAVPVGISAITGTTLGGPVGGIISAAKSLFDHRNELKDEHIEAVQKAYAAFGPELEGLLKDKKETSTPQEISALRSCFTDILNELAITLIVVVDDLDRCLPQTAISTLEAMRLLLFMPNTAFIIAADEKMIRNAVNVHFNDNNLPEEMATSYFDKLIQVPLRVPQLGINEIKAYLILLYVDKLYRDKKIMQQQKEACTANVMSLLANSWHQALTKESLREACTSCIHDGIDSYIQITEDLAPIFATAEQIKGNPRLIKRFLNNLEIWVSIASAHKISAEYATLAKMQLFERCASSAALTFLTTKTMETDDGKVPFIKAWEEAIIDGTEYTPEDPSWNNPFCKQWICLQPQLSQIDLRPLLYLGNIQTFTRPSFDILSEAAITLSKALDDILKDVNVVLIEKLSLLPNSECEVMMNRLLRDTKANQWKFEYLLRGLHIAKANASCSSLFVTALKEIPPATRINALSLIPLIRDEKWAEILLNEWDSDKDTPGPVRKAIELRRK